MNPHNNPSLLEQNVLTQRLYNQQSSVLIVDDTPDNLTFIRLLLKDFYKIKIANNGETALRIAQSPPPPDLILLDIMMPEMDGYKVCRQLKSDARTWDIPVIFLTARADPEDETFGLGLGAVDYIIKPINPSIVLSRVKTHLELKIARDFLKDRNAFLEDEVSKRTREVAAIQDVTIHAMASLAETRDNETGNHIRRTQFYVKLLAEKLRHHPRFKDVLDNDKTIDLIIKSAPLHDIGKVGIPDRILLKPGRFEPEEFEIMKRHTTLGRDAIIKAEESLDLDHPFLTYAKEIAYSHHEKWDGSGYPEGLSGEAIPLTGRIMALADVYDALISRRVYKEGMPHAKAVEIILQGNGTHFDPDVMLAFRELADEFKAIAEKYQDNYQDIEKSALT
ncbi:MAG: two-component system response regulator [Betaproteobacteria bacterium]